MEQMDAPLDDYGDDDDVKLFSAKVHGGVLELKGIIHKNCVKDERSAPSDALAST